jgi:MFS family permease
VHAGGQLGNIFTAFSAGLTAGAFVWGVLVDIIGKALHPFPEDGISKF